MRWLTYGELKDLASAIQSFATVISFLIGGIWVYRRYVRQQENYPNIESSADIIYIGEQADWIIVELIGEIENKGKVQHKMKEFKFDLNALYPGDQIEGKEEWGGQVHFPHLVKEGSFLPQRYKFFYVDPGIKAKYSYVAHVPKQTSFLILHCWFEYMDERKFRHVAEKTVSVSRLKEEKLLPTPKPS